VEIKSCGTDIFCNERNKSFKNLYCREQITKSNKEENVAELIFEAR
jgi:hypothetical protein